MRDRSTRTGATRWLNGGLKSAPNVCCAQNGRRRLVVMCERARAERAIGFGSVGLCDVWDFDFYE